MKRVGFALWGLGLCGMAGLMVQYAFFVSNPLPVNEREWPLALEVFRVRIGRRSNDRMG